MLTLTVPLGEVERSCFGQSEGYLCCGLSPVVDQEGLVSEVNQVLDRKCHSAF